MKFAILESLERIFQMWYDNGYLLYAILGIIIVGLYLVFRVIF